MYYKSIYDSYYFLYNQSIGNPQKNKIIASGFTRVWKDERKERIELRSKSPKFHLIHSYYYSIVSNFTGIIPLTNICVLNTCLQ